MEVISPTITIKVVGLNLGGLILYILNKMKDNIYIFNKINFVVKFDQNILNSFF